MIYVSSSSFQAKTIRVVVESMLDKGIKNIELSGGTEYYPEYLQDLIKLKNENDINFLVHNYFPPPETGFILNLASADKEIYQTSLEHCKRAIEVSHQLGGKQYGIHAGFLIDFSTSEIGKKIKYRKINDRQKCLDLFCAAFNELKEFSRNDVVLYLENNVFSSTNFKTYQGENPFLLTCYEGYQELSKILEFNLLLDLAHLKVSTKTLGFDFLEETRTLVEKS